MHPDQPILRSADQPLPARAEVVVVGGGVMGASIAFHLAEAGVRDVLLLEQSSLASGSTSKSAGGVRAQFSDEVNIRLGARSLELLEAFGTRPGQEIDLHRVGYLFLLSDPADVAGFEDAVRLQNALGVPTRMLTPAQAGELAPVVRTDDLVAATFHPGDGYCSPESVVQGYAAGARAHGAVIRTGVQVAGVQTTGPAGARTVTGVRTTAGDVAAPTVICAAGAWSAAIGESAGVTLPVTPLRRQILVTEPVDAALERLVPASSPMTIDFASTFYLHREGPGVLIGMSYTGEQPGFRLDLSDDWMPDLTAAIEHRAPALLEVGIAHGWAGLYEVTPDHNAIIGEAAGVSRFLYATGFSGHGFLQGPAVGEVVRDLYLERQPFVDVAPLSVERFAGGTRPEKAIV